MKASRYILLLFNITLLGLLYIYQQVEPVRISYEIQQNKRVLMQLKQENRLLRYKFALLASPLNLEKEIDKRNIQLCEDKRPSYVRLNPCLPQPGVSTFVPKAFGTSRYSGKGFLKIFGRKAEAEQR